MSNQQPVALADQFSFIFREEHRIVRDALLELAEAFERRDRSRIESLLGQAAAFVGPHFRYEEESLYPALVGLFGEEYVEKLLSDHDRAIGIAQRLVEMAQGGLSDDNVRQATRLIRGSVLPHVSDCDGLSIMVEKLSEDEVQRVLDARERSLRDGLSLFDWASQVRQRPILPCT